jgi:hypothetical protein
MASAAVSTIKHPKENVRHEIEPELVRVQIEKKVADYEKQRISWKEQARQNVERYEQAKLEGLGARWTRAPDTPAYVDGLIDDWIETERRHYATVRVIELPQAGKRFVLVYGDVDDAVVTRGTGAFDSFETAQAWFLQAGR